MQLPLSICLYRLTFAQNRTVDMESTRMHKVGTHKYPPRRQSGYSDPRTTSSNPSTTGSPNIPLFIRINCTHTHRRVTLLQHVDLNNTCRPSLLIDAFFVITAPAHSVMPHYARGFTVLIIWQQSPATFSVARHNELIALYASAPNHVLGH